MAFHSAGSFCCQCTSARLLTGGEGHDASISSHLEWFPPVLRHRRTASDLGRLGSGEMNICSGKDAWLVEGAPGALAIMLVTLLQLHRHGALWSICRVLTVGDSVGRLPGHHG